jgi:hypothetical protein
VSFVWSAASQRYRDEATGRFVSQVAVNQAVDAVIKAGSQHMVTMTQALQTNQITLAEWQTQMATEIKMLHTGAAALGRGGWAQMTQSDWGWTGQRIRAQYGWLRNFAHDIAVGHQPMDGRLLARAAMYAEATRATQREMQRFNASVIGRTQERNVLGAAEHCGGCLSATARGWVPLGTLPAIGNRECRSRCRCSIVTRREPEQLVAA